MKVTREKFQSDTERGDGFVLILTKVTTEKFPSQTEIGVLERPHFVIGIG